MFSPVSFLLFFSLAIELAYSELSVIAREGVAAGAQGVYSSRTGRLLVRASIVAVRTLENRGVDFHKPYLAYSPVPSTLPYLTLPYPALPYHGLPYNCSRYAVTGERTPPFVTILEK